MRTLFMLMSLLLALSGTATAFDTWPIYPVSAEAADVFDIAIDPTTHLPCVAYAIYDFHNYNVFFSSLDSNGEFTEPEHVYSYQDSEMIMCLPPFDLAIDNAGKPVILFTYTLPDQDPRTFEHVGRLLLAERKNGMWTTEQVSEYTNACRQVAVLFFWPYTNIGVAFSQDNEMWLAYGMRWATKGDIDPVWHHDVYVLHEGTEDKHWSNDEITSSHVSLAMCDGSSGEAQPRVLIRKKNEGFRFAERGTDGSWTESEIADSQGYAITSGTLKYDSRSSVDTIASQSDSTIFFAQKGESNTWDIETVWTAESRDYKNHVFDNGPDGPQIVVLYEQGDKYEALCKYRSNDGWKSIQPSPLLRSDTMLGFDTIKLASSPDSSLPYVLSGRTDIAGTKLSVSVPPQIDVIVEDKDNHALLSYPDAQVALTSETVAYKEVFKSSSEGHHYLSMIPKSAAPYQLTVAAKGYKIHSQELYVNNVHEVKTLTVSLEKNGCGISLKEGDRGEARAAIAFAPACGGVLLGVVVAIWRRRRGVNSSC